jgi:hypothetical protein
MKFSGPGFPTVRMCITNLFPPSTLCTPENYPHDPVDNLPGTRSCRIMRPMLKAKGMGIDPGDISGLEE